MLQITRPVGQGCFIASPAAYAAGVELLSDGSYYGHVFGPIMKFFPTPDAGFSIKGRITTTPSDARQGENECYHSDYSGVIHPAGYSTYPYASPTPEQAWTIQSKPVKMERKVWNVRTPSKGTLAYTTEVLYGEELMYHDSFSAVRWISPYDMERYNCDINVVSSYDSVLGYHLIAFSYRGFVNRNGKLREMTALWTIGVEYDPYRGVRYACPSLHAVVWVTNVFHDPQALKAYVLSRYNVNPSRTGGSFSWDLFGPIIANKVDDGPGIDDVRLAEFLKGSIDNLLPFQLPDLGELSYRCVSQLQTWDGNGIALAHDLLTMKQQVTALRSLLGGVKNPRNWASLFLSVKYGIPLTVSDIKSLRKGIDDYLRFSQDRKVSSSTNWSQGLADYECHYGLYYNPYDTYLSDLDKKLMLFDAYPSYKNVWDLIPFSFVVDWFLDIGNYLEHLDSANVITRYNIICDVLSLKVTRVVEPRDLGFPMFEGPIEIKRYSRVFSRSPVTPSYDKNDLSARDFDHWLEGGALIVQKIFN